MICLDKNVTLNRGRYEFNDIVVNGKGRICKITNIRRCDEPQPWDEITFDDGSTSMPGNIKDLDLSYKVLLKLGFKKLTSTFSSKRPTDYTYDGGDFRMIYTIANGRVIIQPRNGELQAGKLAIRSVRALQRVKFTPKKPEEVIPEGTASNTYFDAATVHLKDVMNFDVLIDAKL